MAFVMDTLGYAKKLESAGVKREHAEAIAEAQREYVMDQIVTKADLRDALETQTLRLTIRLGTIVIGGLAALEALRRFIG